MANPFAYAELHSYDIDASGAFYTDLFDWRLKTLETPMGRYTEIDPGSGFPGGMLQSPDGSGPARWVSYIQVEDVAAATEKAKGLGAKPVYENQEVPGEGRFSLMVDPGGATFGMWERLNG